MGKVEPPSGDPLRSTGPFLDDEPGPDRSLLLNRLHSGKESVARPTVGVMQAAKDGLGDNLSRADGSELPTRASGGRVDLMDVEEAVSDRAVGRLGA